MKILVILQGPAYGTEAMLIPQAFRSSLDGVTDWAFWADKTITF